MSGRLVSSCAAVVSLALVGVASSSLQAQAPDTSQAEVDVAAVPPEPEDVATLDGIIRAFYEVISGPAGQPRQWARDRSLYIPDVRFVSMSVEDGKPEAAVMDHQAYVDRVNWSLVQHGFFEREIHRITRRFGNIAHVFSVYEWQTERDGEARGRGINSLELFHDGERWWIAAAMWEDERPENPIPAEFLP